MQVTFKQEFKPAKNLTQLTWPQVEQLDAQVRSACAHTLATGGQMILPLIIINGKPRGIGQPIHVESWNPIRIRPQTFTRAYFMPDLPKGQTPLVACCPFSHFKPESLTRREIQVLTHIALGCTALETGQSLFLAERTVRDYLGKARQKLGARNAPHGVALALARGVISFDTFYYPADARRPISQLAIINEQ